MAEELPLPPDVPPAARLHAPVAEVTLCEDRAHIVRRGRAKLVAGPQRVRVFDVAGVMADKTLSAVIEGAGDRVSVDDVRVRRRWVAKADQPEAVRALTLEQEKVQRERDKLQERHDRADGRRDRWTSFVSHAVDEMVQDVSWGTGPEEAWRKRWRAGFDAVRKADAEIRECEVKLEQLDETLSDLQNRINAASGGQPQMRAWIDLDVTAKAAGEFDIRFDYVVGGACWRPAHVARLVAAAPARLEWECVGTAWQYTGEDWTDVTLRFSTQRTTLGIEPPQLSSDLLTAQKRAPAVQVEAREETIQTTGPDAPGGRAAEVPGIDDGGEIQTLKAAAKATVPSDGRPHRVPLFRFAGEAKPEWVCVPELAPAVILKSTQVNGAPHPILAGPVDLIRDQGRVGRTTVLYVAPGAPFILGFGPDPELRVRRTHEQIVHERGMLSAWEGREQRLDLRFSNLGPGRKQFSVQERVPVSEIEKVQIALDEKETTRGGKPDTDGFVRWTVTVAPFAGEKLHLRYTVKVHKDVTGF